MSVVLRLIACFGLAVLLPGLGLAQSESAAPTASQTDSGQITGTVSVDSKPASGITVMLVAQGDANRPLAVTFNTGLDASQVKARVVTDTEGHYIFRDVAAANYAVFPFGPALAAGPIAPGMSTPGKAVNLQPGEAIDGVDFSLSRGGVITGKVTRYDGQPAIAVSLDITSENKDGVSVDLATGKFMREVETDDRGIYRAYGLSPGRYSVCVQPTRSAGYALSTSFCYQIDSDEGHKNPVNLAAGQEVTNVDIAMAAPAVGYEAAGRIVDDGGNPVADAPIYYYDASDADGGSTVTEGPSSDQDGRFKISGLVPGRYGVSINFGKASSSYCLPSTFEITDGNVSDLQIKVHASASISGTVVVEGTNDPQVLAQVPDITLQLYSYGPESSRMVEPTEINPSPDGTFQATGLPPGTLNIGLSPWVGPSGFSLLQIVRDGMPQNEIAISAGEKVTDIKISLAYGTGSIRGQVTIPGGTLAQASELMIFARLISADSNGPQNSAVPDSRGRFEITGLPDGQYQVIMVMRGPAGFISQVGPSLTVSGGQAPDVTLVFDASKKSPTGS